MGTACVLPAATPRASSLLRRAAAAAALTGLLLLPSGCADEHHYAVGLDGSFRRVDEDGHPLPGEAAQGGAGSMANGALANAADEAGDGGGIARDHGAAAAGAAATAGVPAGTSGGSLRGTVSLPSDLGVDPARFMCLFLIGRRNPGSPSPDFVRRIDHPQFPQEFEITAADGKFDDAALSGSYLIVARLDGDGDAAAQLGDVQGISIEAALPGGPPVSIVLNQLLSGDGQGPRPAPFASAPASDPHIDGTVELDPAFADLAGTGRLFVIVRSAQTQGGMPIAVLPVDDPQFPQAFRVTTEHIPLDVDNKAEMLAGELKIKARLSLGGGPIGAAGDIESEELLVRAGGESVTLRLSQRREK